MRQVLVRATGGLVGCPSGEISCLEEHRWNAFCPEDEKSQVSQKRFTRLDYSRSCVHRAWIRGLGECSRVAPAYRSVEKWKCYVLRDGIHVQPGEVKRNVATDATFASPRACQTSPPGALSNERLRNAVYFFAFIRSQRNFNERPRVCMTQVGRSCRTANSNISPQSTSRC